jgi:hypothetical protein
MFIAKSPAAYGIPAPIGAKAAAEHLSQVNRLRSFGAKRERYGASGYKHLAPLGR